MLPASPVVARVLPDDVVDVVEDAGVDVVVDTSVDDGADEDVDVVPDEVGEVPSEAGGCEGVVPVARSGGCSIDWMGTSRKRSFT